MESASTDAAIVREEFVASLIAGDANLAEIIALDAVLASGHAPRGVLVGGRAVPEPLRTDARVRFAEDARQAIALIEELADPV